MIGRDHQPDDAARKNVSDMKYGRILSVEKSGGKRVPLKIGETAPSPTNDSGEHPDDVARPPVNHECLTRILQRLGSSADAGP